MPSEQQPPKGTGRNSQNSQPTSQEEMTLADQLTKMAGVKRLGLMMGLQSLQRNLEAEDRAVAETYKTTEDSGVPRSDDMNPEDLTQKSIMCGGDFNLYPDNKQQTYTQPPSNQPTPTSPLSKLLPWLLAAAIPATAAGTYYATRPDPPPVIPGQPDTDTRTTITFDDDDEPQ